MDFINIIKTFHPKVADYTFFASVHRTFSRIDHMWGQKENFYKYKKTEIIPSTFSDHNGIELEINNKKKTERHTNM